MKKKNTKKVGKRISDKEARATAKKASVHLWKFCDLMGFDGMQRISLMGKVVEVSLKLN